MMDGRADPDGPPVGHARTRESPWPWIVLLAFAVLGCLTFGLNLHFPGPGIDASYTIGTYLAVTRHLQFGRDIIFNYGPLHLLESGMYFTTAQWLGYVFVAAVLPQVLLVWALAALVLRELRNVPLGCLVTVAALMALPSLTPIKLALATALFFYLMATSRDWSAVDWILVLVSSAMLAVQGLTKFTTMYQGIATMVLAILAGAWQRRRQMLVLASAMAGTYAVATLVAWCCAGQSLGSFPSYLRTGREIVLGFSAAMSTTGPWPEVVLGLVCTLTLALTVPIGWACRARATSIFGLVNAGTIALAFKTGFVRHDVWHILPFWATATVLEAALALVAWSDARAIAGARRGVVRAVACWCALLAVATMVKVALAAPPLTTWCTNRDMLASAIARVHDPAVMAERVVRAKEEIRAAHPLDRDTLRFLEGKSVDVFTTEIALIYGYDLEWSPRPVIQSYQAYTPTLDAWNAQHMNGASAPQAVLYAPNTVDGRYAPWDEPATFWKLVTGYRFVRRTDEFAVLERNDEQPRVETVDLGTVKTRFGAVVSVPVFERGYVLAEVAIKHSRLGHLLALAYKSSPVFVTFKLKSRGRHTHRFVPPTGTHDLLVSDYAGSVQDISALLDGSARVPIERFSFRADHPWEFKDSITVKFTGCVIER
jgi:hypothetical protein